ncbi:MAG: hypothetical protein LBQ80_01165 [Clostridium sp.]|jgi:hypothetical protein|nr:hypothetical protein [Clostridium sp.]
MRKITKSLAVILACVTALICSASIFVASAAEQDAVRLEHRNGSIVEYHDVVFGPSVFEQPSSVYSPQLAKLSCSLGELSECDLVPNMQLLGIGDCYKYVSSADSNSSFPNYFIGARQMTINGKDTAVFILYCQGTGSSFAQIMNCLKLATVDYCGYNVHAGFRELADELWNSLAAFIDRNPQLPKERKLLLTGFSAGAAAVNLMGLRFNTEKSNTIAQKDDVYVYGFANPNVYVGGKSDTVDFNNIFCIDNLSDPIPRLPFNTVFGEWNKPGIIYVLDDDDSSSGHNFPHRNPVYLKGIDSVQPGSYSTAFSFTTIFKVAQMIYYEMLYSLRG